MRTARTAAAAAALTALLLPITARTATATPRAVGAATAPLRASGQTVTLPVRDALAQLPVRAEDRTGYDGYAWRHLHSR
ncbi:hypothetical protein [Streptomyces mexicanus]|uniref:hypothetical protein n=1 Tax=Streptomyces mexicanus TaxID=178566 RepID=UPI00365FFD8F